MAIVIEKQKNITLNERPLVTLDPDTLDCCGVNRPICNPSPCNNSSVNGRYFGTTICSCSSGCRIIKTCNLNSFCEPNISSISATTIDNSVGISGCPTTVNSVNISLDDFSVFTYGNSNITYQHFSENGVEGIAYTGLADKQKITLSGLIEVPFNSSTLIPKEFVTFNSMVNVVNGDYGLVVAFYDVDERMVYINSLRPQLSMLSFIVDGKSQDFAEGRWVTGKSMRLNIDIYLYNAQTIYLSNITLSYLSK